MEALLAAMAADLRAVVAVRAGVDDAVHVEVQIVCQRWRGATVREGRKVFMGTF